MFNYNKEIFQEIKNKDVLKAISILFYTAAKSDLNQEITIDEQMILKTIITTDFGLSDKEHLQIFDEFQNGNLFEDVINATQIIKNEKNNILNNTILDVISKIIASDNSIDNAEGAVLNVIKEELLN